MGRGWTVSSTDLTSDSSVRTEKFQNFTQHLAFCGHLPYFQLQSAPMSFHEFVWKIHLLVLAPEMPVLLPCKSGHCYLKLNTLRQQTLAATCQKSAVLESKIRHSGCWSHIPVTGNANFNYVLLAMYIYIFSELNWDVVLQPSTSSLISFKADVNLFMRREQQLIKIHRKSQTLIT